MNSFFSRKNLALFALVVGVAASISILSYYYSVSTSERIESIAIRDIQSNADIQSHDLANSISNKLGDAVNTVEILAGSPAILQGDTERAKALLNRADESTGEMVDFFMWLDQDGRMQWVSNINETAYQQFASIDLSYRMYFISPKETHQLYYSSVVESNDQINRLYLSYPILASSNNDEFRGIVVAAIRTDALGRFLEDQLSPSLQSEVTLLDKTGIILYSERPEFVGKNVFGVRYQSYLVSTDVELLRIMNEGLKDSLAGRSGSSDVPVGDDNKATFAFKPIMLQGEQFGVVYIVAPHAHAADVVFLIEQQKNLSVALIIVVAAAAMGVIVVIFFWNKRLEDTVRKRTAELVQANDQLVSHDKLQKEFINIAAHELRTPVQPLLGVAEMLDHQFKAGEKEITISKPELDMIMRNTRRLLRLSSRLLEVSRIESNTLKLKMEPIDLGLKIVTMVQDLESILPPGRNVKFRIDNRINPEDEPLLVNADRERIFEVVSNLLSNAVKFTTDGEIVVILEKGQDGNSMIASIVDSGKGIDQDMLPRLFTKFATNSEMGTGLGLFIAKSIIEAHGGSVWAKNNEGAKGAAFSFSLPIIQSAKAE